MKLNLVNLALIFMITHNCLCSKAKTLSAMRQSVTDADYTIIKNTMVRNTSPDRSKILKPCEYFREWTAKYAFKSADYSHIYYFAYECLDKDFKLVKKTISFNYDGSEKRMPLPEGCPMPFIQNRKETPCENGIALGDQMYKDISTITTRKIMENPLSAAVNAVEYAKTVNGDTTVDMEKLSTLTRDLPKLEAELAQLMKDSMTNNPKNITPTEIINNTDGSKTENYTYPDGTKATRKLDVNGSPVEDVIEKPDKSSVKVQYEENKIIKTLLDKDGKVESSTHHIPITNPNSTGKFTSVYNIFMIYI